jgi:hypothetical protein
MAMATAEWLPQPDLVQLDATLGLKVDLGSMVAAGAAL